MLPFNLVNVRRFEQHRRLSKSRTFVPNWKSVFGWKYIHYTIHVLHSVCGLRSLGGQSILFCRLPARSLPLCNSGALCRGRSISWSSGRAVRTSVVHVRGPDSEKEFASRCRDAVNGAVCSVLPRAFGLLGWSGWGESPVQDVPNHI